MSGSKDPKVFLPKNTQIPSQDRFTHEHLLDKVDRDVVFCAVCTNIIKNPIELSPCGHLFCKLCVETMSTISVKCPLCQGEISKKNESKAFVKIINSFKVRCCNVKCDKQYLIGNITNHLTKECLYEEILCKLCNKKIVKIEMDKHLEDCYKQPVECKDCKESFPRKDNHSLVCPNSIVSCIYQEILGCKDRHKRKDILQHENDVGLHFHLSLSKIQNKKPTFDTIYIDVLDIHPRNKLGNYNTDDDVPQEIRESDLAKNIWEPATVIDFKDDQILIRYLGWDDSANEYINVKKNLYRIARFRSKPYKLLTNTVTTGEMHQNLLVTSGVYLDVDEEDF